MRGEYSTKQKRGILNFLKEHELENFSVDDLVFHLEQDGDKVGRSTVYRYLESLAEQGSVRKYQNAQGMTQYQHVSDDGRCDRHFHMPLQELRSPMARGLRMDGIAGKAYLGSTWIYAGSA